MGRRGAHGGRSRGHGRGRRRRRVLQFLQPCLLLLLQSGEAHGYALLDELERFGFDRERVDPTLVYRALREMEEAGWIQSSWDEESQGPRRRVYTLHKEGKRQLTLWIEDLRKTQSEIEHLLREYKDQEDVHDT
ncbi:MAG TPA: helix-turn-helix transcriptional regulator [Anaerolineales bacterium]|nr:helix-turn-helix transcriptional regulator [Anaerolineales bacterium]